jgi:succinate-semialdehyde dehydrogenase / glutarate-semialdehyde dehydrogenase
VPIATVNPTTGETIKTFEPLGGAEVEQRLNRAQTAFRDYRATSFTCRAELLRAAAGLLEQERAAVASMITLEMGKPLTAARQEAVKCVKAMRWYAEHAEELLADEHPASADIEDSGAADVIVRYRPLGPVLAIMPWNFPLWQVIRFAAPALMAGNVGLLKHASSVPQTALYIEDLFRRAGYPEGCFQTLLLGSHSIADLLRDPRIAAATLTGSEPAGRSVASIAGDSVKKTVLELGGSDPYVVLPSADLGKAVATAVTARVQNTGQSCIAAKRFVVHTDVYDDFAHRFVQGMSELTLGDPMDEATEVGPFSSEQGRRSLEDLVDDAVASGAQVLCGGRRPERWTKGWFYEPTVLTGVSSLMRIHHEETFGPVATLYQVVDLDEALLIANDTPFGLSSSVWTRDAGEQERCARDMEAGNVYFNGMTASHPAFPFGGVKRSGYGRELAAHGIREFCNVTTLWYG